MNLATVKEITIPEGNVSSIYFNGEKIWSKCLHSTKLIECKYKIYKNDITKTIGAYSFSGKDNITSVSFTAATEIGEASFSSCDNLSSINFPLVTDIGDNAFAGYLKFSSITFPSAINIGSGAFGSVHEYFRRADFPVAVNIGSGAFASCTRLYDINFPKAVNIGSAAFANCHLQDICFPSAKVIDLNCFNVCTYLQKADFPVLSSIGETAFNGCSVLETLILRNSEEICSLANINAFTGTLIESGTGYIYVPQSMIDAYINDSVWSSLASQFRAIEDYTSITGGV